jgi:hypothetical protein
MATLLCTAELLKLLLTVACHVDHIAVGSTHEESPQSSSLSRQWIDNLKSSLFGLCVRFVNIGAHEDRDNRVHRRCGIAGHELDVDSTVR